VQTPFFTRLRLAAARLIELIRGSLGEFRKMTQRYVHLPEFIAELLLHVAWG
jgi:hypothetical protein